MTAFALISGALFRAPEQKISKAGRTYATATIKTRADDNQFWRLTAFSESVIDELMRLREGDNIAAQGPLKAELYQPDGKEPRINLSIIADSVTALRGKPKERASKSESDQPSKSYSRPREAIAANGDGRDMPHLRVYGTSKADPQLDDEIGF